MAQTERQRYVEWCWFLVVVFVQYIPSIYILYVQWPAYLYLLKQKAEIFVFFSDKIIYQRFKDFFEVALSFLFPRLKINLVSYIVIKHYFLLSFMKIGCRTDAFMCITLKQAHKSINVEQYHRHIFCSVSFEKIISKWSRKTEIFDWQSAVEVAGWVVCNDVTTTSPGSTQALTGPSGSWAEPLRLGLAVRMNVSQCIDPSILFQQSFPSVQVNFVFLGNRKDDRSNGCWKLPTVSVQRQRQTSDVWHFSYFLLTRYFIIIIIRSR